MTAFQKGDEVQRRSDPSQIGTVIELVQRHAGMQWYRVSFGGGRRPVVAEEDLRAFVPGSDPDFGSFAGAEEFQRLIVQERLVRDDPLRNNIYAFNASRIRFYPYQFKPLLKFLDSHHNRLLIADEVGLGKTIEAGLILLEVKARQTVQRVLVVCPASLTAKWQMELRKRFSEKFRISKGKEFLEQLDEYERHPDTTEFSTIVSYESVRRANVFPRLEEVTPDFDLVIFDEAHHMRNFGTNTREAGQHLCVGAKSVLFLTATPIMLGSQNLFSLLNLLDDQEFPDEFTFDRRVRENEPVVKAQVCLSHVPPSIDEALHNLREASRKEWFAQDPALDRAFDRVESLAETSKGDRRELMEPLLQAQRDLEELNLLSHIFTRTKKKQVHGRKTTRKAVAQTVQFTDREARFYNAVTAFVRRRAEERYDSALVQSWLLITPQRRLASCIPAMVEYYRQNLGLDVADRSEDEETIEGGEQWQASPSTEQRSLVDVREELRRIIAAWPSEAEDSKYQKLREALREVRKEDGRARVMIFAFYKATLHYLQRRLEKDDFSSVLITGDVTPELRTDLVDRFREDPGIEILLSSRVGTEGLDFQFCNTLVNYDLPWNPMEVEQRIGRLDRIGQDSDVVRIINLWVEGTIEERILKRLYSRVRVFEHSIGELDTILGDTMGGLERDLFSKALTPEQEEEKLELALQVVERRQKELATLEQEAARFIGTDVFFRDEVEKIRKNRRYVTGPQLQRFILDFLRRDCPRTRLEYDSESKLGKLYPDSDLQEFLHGREDSGLGRIRSAGRRGIPITFDSQTAFDHPNVEFLNVLHPLVQAVSSHYADRPDLLPSSHHVVLRTDGCPPGTYLYFVYRLTVLAAKNQNALEAVFLDVNGGRDIFGEEGEWILGEMVERGSSPRGAELEVDMEAARQAREEAEQLFLNRVELLKSDLERHNDAFIDRRLASLRTFYDRQLNLQRRLLREGEQKDREERYLRLRRGMIHRLEGELKEQEEALEQKRQVGVEYERKAVGILEVIGD